MKNRSLFFGILFVLISVIFAVTLQANAKKSEQKPKKNQKVSASKDPQKRLKKDVSFDDHAVGGQYQIPFGSMTVVEDDKALDDLIGVRKNFHDRVNASKGMR